MKTFLNIRIQVFTILFVMAFLDLSATEEPKQEILKSVISVDFMSMHTWRGKAVSTSPAIEPSIELTKNNSTTGIWLAHSLDGNYSELDLYFTYNLRSFSFTIYDYYCPQTYRNSNEIINYTKNTTKHTIELDVEFKGITSFPISILFATMVYGDDIDQETNKNIYSTYFQFAYSKAIKKGYLNFVLGFNAFESYYGSQFGVVNAGIDIIRKIKVFKSKEIPLQASLVGNPLEQELYLKFGFTL